MHPAEPLKGTLSSGERKAFFSLKENLPDEFIALHSVPLLLASERDRRLLPGEIDFLVCHPGYGVLAIEVKGGAISCDAQNQRWASTSGRGQIYEIKNPYEQVRRNMFLLWDELKEASLSSRYGYPLAFAVWFPDIEIEGTPIGQAEAYTKITLDATCLREPEAEIRRIFRGCIVRKDRPSSTNGISALVNHFVPNWHIKARMRTALNEEELRLIEATRSQFKVLSLLRRANRMLICGSAGSGKTFLAIEKARRLATDGKSVLMLCFNARLADWLRETTADIPNVDTFTYHSLCYHLCALAGVAKPQPDPAVADDQTFYRYQLPEAMLEALDKTTLRYDAVIVDEGQDFDPVWWIGVEQLLKSPGEGTLYIFYDDNQQIYGTRLDFPLPGPPVVLSENCRNTQTILKGFLPFYRGDEAPMAIGPEGRPVEWIEPDGRTDFQIVSKLVGKLMKDEGLEASSITILSGKAEARSAFKEGGQLASRAKLSWQYPTPKGVVHCSTIQSFKGLESSVVIVAEICDLPEVKLRELLYVGYSRAKFHLVVIDTKQSLAFDLPRN